MEELDITDDDFAEIAYTSKEKTAKFTEMCNKLSYTRVI